MFQLNIILGKYDEAQNAIEKVLKLNRTDVETDDIVSEYECKRIIRKYSDSSDSEFNPLKIIKPIENDNEEIKGNLTSSDNFTALLNGNDKLDANGEVKITQNDIQVKMRK